MSATTLTVASPPNLKQSTDFWDLSKRSVAAQRAGRYVPDSKEDPGSLKAGRTWPDAAGAIIDTYSQPGDMMLAPMCGTGVELVEAVWRGRDAVGLELVEQRGDAAVGHLRIAEENGLAAKWTVMPRDARQLQAIWENPFPHALGWVYGRRPSLIIIDPPFSETRQDGGKSRFGSVLHNYTGEDRIKSRAQRDQTNLGNLKHADYLVQMQLVYGQALQVAANGAYMAVITKDNRKDLRRIDLLGDTIRICREAGWRYYDRATLYLGTASHHQRRNATANHNLLPITQDLLVFKKG